MCEHTNKSISNEVYEFMNTRAHFMSKFCFNRRTFKIFVGYVKCPWQLGHLLGATMICTTFRSNESPLALVGGDFKFDHELLFSWIAGDPVLKRSQQSSSQAPSCSNLIYQVFPGKPNATAHLQ